MNTIGRTPSSSRKLPPCQPLPTIFPNNIEKLWRYKNIQIISIVKRRGCDSTDCGKNWMSYDLQATFHPARTTVQSEYSGDSDCTYPSIFSATSSIFKLVTIESPWRKLHPRKATAEKNLLSWWTKRSKWQSIQMDDHLSTVRETISVDKRTHSFQFTTSYCLIHVFFDK